MAEEEIVLRLTVTHLVGKTVHDMPVQSHLREGESSRDAALRLLRKVRDDLDARKTVTLTHPPAMYAPDRIYMVEIDYRDPSDPHATPSDPEGFMDYVLKPPPA